MISQGDFYSSIQLTSEEGSEHLVAKIPNPEHLLLSGLSGCRLQVRGVVQPAFKPNGQRVAAITWVSDFEQVSLMSPTDQEWTAWPESAITNFSEPHPLGEVWCGCGDRLAGRTPDTVSSSAKTPINSRWICIRPVMCPLAR